LGYDGRTVLEMNVPLFLALVLAASAGGPGSEDDAAFARRLIERLEVRQAAARDVVARFVQSYRSGMLGREVVESGKVTIKRPGRMRWEYQEPEKKLFVSDGRTFYFYVPEDRQVIVQEQDDQRSLAGRLLTGQGGLLDEFDVALDEPLEEGVFRVRLTPRKPGAEIERGFVDLEPAGRLRGVLIEDVQGNRTRFSFEDVQENTGVPDRLFHFEIPPGVEVIQG
jgi:outer membrane lipoprotein carrier protein